MLTKQCHFCLEKGEMCDKVVMTSGCVTMTSLRHASLNVCMLSVLGASCKRGIFVVRCVCN